MRHLSPARRRLRARAMAHKKWATTDGRTGTAKARRTFRDSFLDKVDPDGILSSEERRRKADHAYRAHMLSLSEKALAARERKRRRREAAAV